MAPIVCLLVITCGPVHTNVPLSDESECTNYVFNGATVSLTARAQVPTMLPNEGTHHSTQAHRRNGECDPEFPKRREGEEVVGGRLFVVKAECVCGLCDIAATSP